MPYSFVDLFAGAGGMTLGLRMAGFKPLMAFEYSDQSAQTYHRYHPVPVDTRDLWEISAAEIRETLLRIGVGLPNLLVAGPPCETFSRAQGKDIANDRRNYLFRKVLDFQKALCPRYILVENVPGFRDVRNGVYFRELVSKLENERYEVVYSILDAADFGVPQHRERLFVLARQRDRALDAVRSRLSLPYPKHGAAGDFQQSYLRLSPGIPTFLRPRVTAKDALCDLPPLLAESLASGTYSLPPQDRYQRIMRSTLLARMLGVEWDGHHLQNHRRMRHRASTVERYTNIMPGQGLTDVWGILPDSLRPKKNYRARDRRLLPDRPSHTVTAHCVVETLHYDFSGGQHRAISPREAARLQSFPDWYVFTGEGTGRYGDARVQDPYEQIGDAVPPLLARELGKQIRRFLAEDDKQRTSAERENRG